MNKAKPGPLAYGRCIARLNIKGKYHGFSFQVESPGEEFLEAHRGEEGDLFRAMGDPLGRFPYDWGDWPLLRR